MPHDRRGKKLHTGDIVTIPCVIRGIDKHSEYINLAVETLEGRYPDGKHEQFFINAREVQFVQSGGGISATDIDVDAVLRDSDPCKSESTIIKKSFETPPQPED
jgi:hypothetical protein